MSHETSINKPNLTYIVKLHEFKVNSKTGTLERLTPP